MSEPRSAEPRTCLSRGGKITGGYAVGEGAHGSAPSDTMRPSGILREAVRFVGVLCLLAGVAALDAVTGPELSFSIFYLAPVALAAWQGSLSRGIAFGLLAGAVWLVVDLNDNRYTHQAVALWNAGVRAGFFLLCAAAVVRIKKSLEDERRQSRQDTLTGLANSRHFYEHLDREVARSRRNAKPLTVAYVDMDGFKQVNDIHGHLAGDRVLKEAGRALTESIRINDVVARLGGDEFGLLLPESGMEAARTALQRVFEGLIQHMAKNGWPVTASIGAATFLKMPDDIEEIIRRADALMYEVKQRGKSAVVVRQVG